MYFNIILFGYKFQNDNSGFTKLHMCLMVLMKKISVLINFLLQNTNLVSVLSKICLHFAGHVCRLTNFANSDN